MILGARAAQRLPSIKKPQTISTCCSNKQSLTAGLLRLERSSLSYLELGHDPDMAAIPAATRKPQRELPLQESRALMRDHFTEHTGEKYNEGWAKLWEAGDFLPWDRMMPSPALPDTLDNHASVVGSAKLVLPDGTTRRKRALVPGCGRGVDVMLLQAYGYDVVGLEYSSKAVEACEVYAKETENEALYRIKDEKASKGSRVFVQGDFYADDWLEKAGLGEHGKEGVFELIYDYTVSYSINARHENADLSCSSSAQCSLPCVLLGPSECQLCSPRTLRQI